MMSAVLHRRSGLLSMPNREPGVIVKFRESLAILRNYGSPLEIILPMQTLFPREILRQKVLLRCSSIACFWSGLGMDIVPAVGEEETRKCVDGLIPVCFPCFCHDSCGCVPLHGFQRPAKLWGCPQESHAVKSSPSSSTAML